MPTQLPTQLEVASLNLSTDDRIPPQSRLRYFLVTLRLRLKVKSRRNSTVIFEGMACIFRRVPRTGVAFRRAEELKHSPQAGSGGKE